MKVEGGLAMGQENLRGRLMDYFNKEDVPFGMKLKTLRDNSHSLKDFLDLGPVLFGFAFRHRGSLSAGDRVLAKKLIGEIKYKRDILRGQSH